MQVTREDDGTKGRFLIHDGETVAAAMTYSKAGPDKFIIDHTEVGDDYRGQGYGRQLVQAAVDYARKNALSILPLCPYARSVFDKHPELGDVLFRRT